MNLHHNNLSCGYTTAEQFSPMQNATCGSSSMSFHELASPRILTVSQKCDDMSNASRSLTAFLPHFLSDFYAKIRMDSTYLTHFNTFGFRIFAIFSVPCPPGIRRVFHLWRSFGDTPFPNGPPEKCCYDSISKIPILPI